MTSRRFSRYFLCTALTLVAISAFCPAVRAQALVDRTSLDQAVLDQGSVPDAPTSFVEAAPPVALTPSNLSTEHKFLDNQNRVLFLAAAALNGADFAVTRANLQSGGQELNPLVRVFGRSTAGLAVNFVGETAGVIGLSYFFHKTGHHKLERAVSLVNIGGSAGAVSFGLAHR
jgi:hypothetical protein